MASVTTNIVVVDIPFTQLSLQEKDNLLLHQEDIPKNSQDSIEDIRENEEITGNKTLDGLDGGGSVSPQLNNQDMVQDALFQEWGLSNPTNQENSNLRKSSKQSVYKYVLNVKLGAPKVFRRAILSLNNIDIVHLNLPRNNRH